jgi:hypothetical protein
LGKIPFRAWLGQRSLLLTAPENRHYAKGNVIFSFEMGLRFLYCELRWH